MPQVSLLLYISHLHGSKDTYPVWTSTRLDPRLGGCVGNYGVLLTHQLRRGSRVLRYGNYTVAGETIGEVATCYPNGTVTDFTDNMMLPFSSLEQIGLAAQTATAP